MADDFRALAAVMRRAAVAIEDDVNGLCIEIAAAVHYEVAAATPVDTARARSNWVVRVANRGYSGRAAFRPYPSFWRAPYRGGNPGTRMGETTNLAAAQGAARAALSVRRTDQPIYIVNSLPYIKRLGDGYSRLAPAGYIPAAVQRGTQAAVRGFFWPHIRSLRLA